MLRALSGGMERRAVLAHAVAIAPMLVMYDESFAGLDPISLNVITNLIKRQDDARCTTYIVVTYYVSKSLKVVDHVYFMSDGKIVAQGTTAECSNPATSSCASSSTPSRTARCTSTIGPRHWRRILGSGWGDEDGGWGCLSALC